MTQELPTLTVLIEGYAKKTPNGWVASSTVCLIRTANSIILTDPGCNRTKLLSALAQENLTTTDITHVVVTHAHPDHGLLAGIFENARIITWDSGFMYHNDTLTEYTPHELGEHIEIVQTPGHMLEHISLLVTTANGVVAVAGDVIFWLDDEDQILDIHKPDQAQVKGLHHDDLVKSRQLLIDRANYIVPGHGKMFKVER